MTSLAHLLLVACALAAPLLAANIPVPSADNVVPVPELPKPLESIPDVQNPVESELRAGPEAAIPVEVIVENVDSSVKLNEVSDDDEIKRPAIDLRNPGPPQRQEHETQNPEHFSEDALKILTVKDSIEKTEMLLRQGFQGVTDDLQNWFSKNEQIQTIQRNIQSLQSSFTTQIKKLNETLQEIAHPASVEPQVEESQRKSDFNQIESRLKILQDNFHNGVNTLSEGVNIVASLRAEGESGDKPAGSVEPAAPVVPAAPAPPAQPAPPSTTTSPPNFLVQYFGMVQDQVSSSLNNVTTAFGNFVQNVFNRTTPENPPNVQQDEGATTSRPPLFPNWPSWLGGQQGQQSQQSSGPSSGGQFQIFQNLANFQNPFQNSINNIISLAPWNRPTTQVPAQPSEPAAATTDEKPAESKPPPATESKPEAAAENAAEKPADTPAPVQPAPQPLGPIRQILSNSPVVQGIAGAVQRLQNSITNPERPRDTIAESEEVEEKGGWYGGYGGPGGPGGSGDNNNSGIGVKKIEVLKEEKPLEEPMKEKEDIKEEIKKETEEKIKEEMKEDKPEVLAEKTE